SSLGGGGGWSSKEKCCEATKAGADEVVAYTDRLLVSDPVRSNKRGFAAFCLMSRPPGEHTTGKATSRRTRRHLQKAIDIAPHFTEALNNLGTIYYHDKKF